MNASLIKYLEPYKYVYKKDDKVFYATKAEWPFKDEDIIDEYKLYAYDKLDIECGKWYSVANLINE